MLSTWILLTETELQRREAEVIKWKERRAQVMSVCICYTVRMESHTISKRRSPFANGLKSEPVYKRPRLYKNREDARLRQYESGKATWLRARVESE